MTPDGPEPSAEPPKRGRGGRRPGAGRKPKAHVAPSSLAAIDIEAALAEPVPDDVETTAQRHARVALAALVKQMQHGKSDPARIKAAQAILDRGYGKTSTEPGGDLVLPLFPAEAARNLSTEIRDAARRHATLAVEVLHRIMTGSESEAARVSAAQALLDRGLGVAPVARLQAGPIQPDIGKRERAMQDAADLATGIYAPPPPPRSAVH